MVVAERGLPSVLADGWPRCSAARWPPAAPTPSTWYVDRDIDRLMERTQNRPLVTGEITPRDGADLRHRPRGRRLRLAVGARSTCCRAVLAVAACLFYVFVYTLWLKRTSTQQHRDRRRRRRRARCSSAGRRSPAASTGRRSCCSPSSSTGRRRTSGPWPSATATTTPPPTCRCSRRSPACGPPRCASSATRCCCGRSPCSSRRWPTWATSTSASAIVLGARVHRGYAVAPAARPPRPRLAMRLFSWSITYITLLFGAMAVDQLLRSGC